MKSVVIVESPAKCKTINKYLGKDYTVLASYGHIRDLPSKDGSVLPDKDFEMKYSISPRSKKHVKEIEDAVKKADELILATDPDREGESISWHVYETLRKDKIIDKNFPVKRVAFNSITKKAVTDAIAKPRELDLNLINSQQARRALDYLVGFTLSPVLWRKLPGSRSAGRVQSVALRLICEREKEIEAFKPQEYWTIQALFETASKEIFTANLSQAEGTKLKKLDINNEESAIGILEGIKGQSFSVLNINKKRVSRNPKPPFTTSTLQQEASRKLGFSASKTMTLAQKLYEGIDVGEGTTGLITYMRTDGVSIAPEALQETRSAIENIFDKKYLPETPRAYSSKAKNAQEAHEAIRPTDPARTPDSVKRYLDKDQLRLYELVWKRLLSSQMESAVFDQVSADIETADKKYIFRASGSTLVFDGFLKLYREDTDDGEDEDKESKLPKLEEKQQLDLSKAEKESTNPKADQHFTEPPPRYNEASLVKKLEELGIGRPSTYASIISILSDRGYTKLEKRRFIPETRGRLVTEFLNEYFSKYVQYDFTANLEDELDLISDGKLEWKEALRKFWVDFKSNVDEATELRITDVIDYLDKALENIFFPEGEGEEKRKCPKCKDGKQGLRLGKFGAFIGCSNYPECDYTRQILTEDEKKNQEVAEVGEGGATDDKANKFEDKVLYQDEATGGDVTLRKGPYGFYLQIGEQKGKVKPKRASIPRGTNIDDVDVKKAKTLLSLPKTLGKHPDTGEEITSGIGRFGPYIAHNKKFHSLKKQTVFEVTLEDAIELINTAPEPKSKKK